MTPKYIRVGPFKFKPELLTARRFMSWFSPCIWGNADGYGTIRKFLNNTRLGRFFIHKVWESLREKIADVNGYRKHPGLAALEPDE